MVGPCPVCQKLYPYHNLDHHPGEKVLRPALHHLGWPWLRTPLLMITLVSARGVFAIQLTTI